MLRNFGIPFRLVIFLYVFGMFLSPLTGYAQVVDVEFDQPERYAPAIKQTVEQKRDEEYKKAKKRGLKLTPGSHTNPKTGSKYFTAWAKSGITMPYTSKNYINSRQIAFNKAMLDAKKIMVKFIEQDIENQMTLILEQPPQERAQAQADAIKADVIGIQEKRKAADAAQADLEKKGDEWGASVVNATAKGINRLYQNKLAEELKAKGIDPSQPVPESAIQPILNSQKFKEITNVFASEKLVGMQAYQTFEAHPGGKDPDEHGHIGVIALWSPKLELIGKGIASGDTRLIPPGTPQAPLEEQISKDTDDLLMIFGVQMLRDENGAPALVSYCQAGQLGRRGERAARIKAETCAEKQIRQYAGEMVVSKTRDQNAETETEFKDGTLDPQNQSGVDDLIETTAENMTISGIANLHTWDTKHPVSDQIIRGSVVYWSPNSSDMAKAIAQQIAAPITKASEVSNQNRNTTTKKKQAPVSRKPFSGSGSAASDDF